MPDHQVNEHGQPIGRPIRMRLPRPSPPRTSIDGRYCGIEMLDVGAHAAGLHAAFAGATHASDWTYLGSGPFDSLGAYTDWLGTFCVTDDPLFHVVRVKPSGQPAGLLALMRIDTHNGVIEVGHIHFASSIRRSPITTEAVYLLMRRVFDELGYRRLEWKCDALNTRSISAARRLGFTYEGTFRQHQVTKGRNRDTSWFSILDTEWPRLRSAHQAWLAPENFDAAGSQIASLRDLVQS